MARRRRGAESAHGSPDGLGVRQAWNSWERDQVMQIPGAKCRVSCDADSPKVGTSGRMATGSALATAGRGLDVRSGVDWFELRGDAVFDEQTATLPQLLDAVKRRQGDRAPGRRERRHSARGLAARVRDARPRNTSRATTSGSGASQVALLDALLAPEAGRVVGRRPPRVRAIGCARSTPLRHSILRRSFTGTLREYQREGLGWLAFLREFGFGGCLADDMGLGKTVVVLALLDARRQAWEDEGRAAAVAGGRATVRAVQLAAGGCPFRAASCGCSTSRGRGGATACTRSGRTIWCSSPTARCGAMPWQLAGVEFDYVILDEAQTIKNANTAAAQSRARCCADSTGWRSAARRSRTASATCGACSNSSIRGC